MTKDSFKFFNLSVKHITKNRLTTYIKVHHEMSVVGHY